MCCIASRKRRERPAATTSIAQRSGMPRSLPCTERRGPDDDSIEAVERKCFLDIGFPPHEAQNLRVRADLMVELIRIVRSRKVTQAAASKLFGVNQPRVSNLVTGKIDRFSIDPLVEMLARAGRRVEIITKPSRRVA